MIVLQCGFRFALHAGLKMRNFMTETRSTFYTKKRDPGAAWTPARGFRDAIPIFLGYFAVAFSLGIVAGNAGFNAFQGFILSLTNLSSSGQYAGLLLYSENAGYIELALMVLVANARYLLMSFAISQKISPADGIGRRLVYAFGLTDELFGLGIMTPGYLRFPYMLAALCTAAPGWALGTAFGVIVGDILPDIFSEAMNVAIFGMFLAIVIPPGKKNRLILAAVVSSFAVSLICSYAPVISGFSSGTRVLILTLIIASFFAFFFPVKNAPQSQKDSGSEDRKEDTAQ